MAKKNEQELAKQLFLQSDKTQKQIASIVGTQESTIGKWVKEGGWDDLKETLRTSDDQIIRDLYAEMVAINKFIKENGGYPDSKMADARNKVIASINRMQKQVALPQKVAVCMQLLDFVAAKNLTDGKTLDTYIGRFLNDQAKNV
jgi:uncharacterized protein YjcR